MDKYFLCIYLKYFLLQELQHEVSSLLEFKNVLLQTFPDLHHKISSLSSVSGQDVRHLATRGLKTEAGGDIGRLVTSTKGGGVPFFATLTFARVKLARRKAH